MRQSPVPEQEAFFSSFVNTIFTSDSIASKGPFNKVWYNIPL